MEFSKITLVALNVFALLCACVVLGTSADLASDTKHALGLCGGGPACDAHGLLPRLEFGAFAGAWGLVGAFLGLASVFVAAIPWLVVAGWNALTAIFYFADGVALAVWFSDYQYIIEAVAPNKVSEGKANDAFMWLGFITMIALLVCGFLWQRRGSKHA